MVLGWRRPGRVGRCRIPQRKASDECLGLFLCASRQVLLPGRFQANVQHCTWSRNRARPAGRFSEMKAEITKERPGEGVNESP